MSDVVFGNGRTDDASMLEATLGERAWLAQQRRLEVRIDDVRLELLDGARSRHDAVLQAAGNVVRKALLFCQQEFDRLTALITTQETETDRLQTEVAMFDQRLVDARSELERQIVDELAAGIAAERDKRAQMVLEQAALAGQSGSPSPLYRASDARNK